MVQSGVQPWKYTIQSKTINNSSSSSSSSYRKAGMKDCREVEAVGATRGARRSSSLEVGLQVISQSKDLKGCLGIIEDSC